MEGYKCFVVYAEPDKDIVNVLSRHTATLKRNGQIYSWHTQEVLAGKEWKKEIEYRLNNADLILLIVTANFLASDFCYNFQLKNALKRHEDGYATVVPIIASYCDWESTSFSKLQILPESKQPLNSTKWIDKDEVFLSIVESIRKTIYKKNQIKKESINSLDLEIIRKKEELYLIEERINSRKRQIERIIIRDKNVIKDELEKSGLLGRYVDEVEELKELIMELNTEFGMDTFLGIGSGAMGIGNNSFSKKYKLIIKLNSFIEKHLEIRNK